MWKATRLETRPYTNLASLSPSCREEERHYVAASCRLTDTPALSHAGRCAERTAARWVSASYEVGSAFQRNSQTAWDSSMVSCS